MKLIITGCYKEIPNGKTNNLKSIKECISNSEYTNKQKIVDYLKNGVSVAIAPGGDMHDILNKNNPGIGIEEWLTDGKYTWCSYLQYYVENYNLQLDNDFLNNIKNNNYKIPISESDIDFDTLEITQ